MKLIQGRRQRTGEMQEVTFALAIRRTKTPDWLLHTGQTGQGRSPCVFIALWVGLKAHTDTGRELAQIINVPMGFLYRGKVVFKAAPQASRPEGAPDIGIYPGRKIKSP